MEPDNHKLRRFNEFLDSGEILPALIYRLRKNLIGGLFMALIGLGYFFYKDSLLFLGKFSPVSALYLAAAALAATNILAPSALFLAAFYTYAILRTMTEIELKTVVGAALIGGNLSSSAKMHSLLKHQTDINSTKIDIAFVTGTLASFLTLGITGLILARSTGAL